MFPAALGVLSGELIKLVRKQRLASLRYCLLEPSNLKSLRVSHFESTLTNSKHISEAELIENKTESLR